MLNKNVFKQGLRTCKMWCQI